MCVLSLDTNSHLCRYSIYSRPAPITTTMAVDTFANFIKAVDQEEETEVLIDSVDHVSRC